MKVFLWENSPYLYIIELIYPKFNLLMNDKKASNENMLESEIDANNLNKRYKQIWFICNNNSRTPTNFNA